MNKIMAIKINTKIFYMSEIILTMKIIKLKKL